MQNNKVQYHRNNLLLKPNPKPLLMLHQSRKLRRLQLNMKQQHPQLHLSKPLPPSLLKVSRAAGVVVESDVGVVVIGVVVVEIVVDVAVDSVRWCGRSRPPPAR